MLEQFPGLGIMILTVPKQQAKKLLRAIKEDLQNEMQQLLMDFLDNNKEGTPSKKEKDRCAVWNSNDDVLSCTVFNEGNRRYFDWELSSFSSGRNGIVQFIFSKRSKQRVYVSCSANLLYNSVEKE